MISCMPHLIFQFPAVILKGQTQELGQLSELPVLPAMRRACQGGLLLDWA